MPSNRFNATLDCFSFKRAISRCLPDNIMLRRILNPAPSKSLVLSGPVYNADGIAFLNCGVNSLSLNSRISLAVTPLKMQLSLPAKPSWDGLLVFTSSL